MRIDVNLRAIQHIPAWFCYCRPNGFKARGTAARLWFPTLTSKLFSSEPSKELRAHVQIVVLVLGA